MLLGYPADAQPAAFDPAVATASCATGVSNVSLFNSDQLLRAAADCAAIGEFGDGNFLYAAAQLRGMADLRIFEPANLDDEEAYNTTIWLYYGAMSVGFDEFYATPENVKALEAGILSVVLPIPPAYDPGWAFAPTSKTRLYADLIDYLRTQLIWTRRSVALLMQDAEYYAAFMAGQALWAEVRAAATPDAAPGSWVGAGITPGMPEYAEYNRLRAQMAAAAARIPELSPPPEDLALIAALNAPEPDLAERLVAFGFNGPATSSTNSSGIPLILRSENDVRQSWLARALPADELARLLADTDFARHVLVVFALGAHDNAAGPVVFNELTYDARFGGYTLNASVGVVPDDCRAVRGNSYPFVVGIIDAVPNARPIQWGETHFPVLCGPVITAEPVNLP